MKAIVADVVWRLRRDKEFGRLASSLRMADAIEDLAQAAGFDATAVVAAAHDVRTDVEQRRKSIDARLKADRGALAWTGLRREARASEQVQAGHVSLLQGALTRHLRAVRVGAVAADRYLAELGRLSGVPWTGVAVPGVAEEHEREHGSVQFTFASPGFWELPILAHEFGHVVEGKLTSTELDGIEQRLPLQQLVNRLAEEHGCAVSIIREYLSDVFAVYVAGPAYVCALVLLRFDPASDPRLDAGETHPSDARRAAAVLDALRRLDESPIGAFAGIADTLSATWQAMTTVARPPRPGEPDDPTGELRLVDAMWPELERMSMARFTAARRDRAAQLEQHLANVNMTSKTSIGDLLAAGWMHRFRRLCDGKDVEDDLGDRLLDRIAR